MRREGWHGRWRRRGLRASPRIVVAVSDVVVGSAGSGKSVLLSSWAAGRPPGVTSWLSCDAADVNPVRFWAAFIEASRAIAPWFGIDAADLLAMDGVMSADVIASIANDAARLPAGSAIIVDDFHAVAAAVAVDMTDLVERWPAETAQLVLAGAAGPGGRCGRPARAGRSRRATARQDRSCRRRPPPRRRGSRPR